MVFSSLLFLTIFLPLTLLLYYVIPGKGKNVLLLVVSLIFYAWGEPTHIILMLITTVYTWALCLPMEKAKARGRKATARVLMILCLIFSLGTLVYFKYFGFIVENLPFLRDLGLRAPALPIGISFYTFQSLSYVLDVYRGDVKAQRSWINFAMYISLFPQLVAGPIVRYADVEQQLAHRPVEPPMIFRGLVRFLVGLGKKVLLANQIGLLWTYVSGMSELTAATAWLGAIAFAFQIYFDFSAYSDMAIGMGMMLGFHFPENFRYPYTSRSITDFWRRWHITLGTWFREYVYIPLGGNRVSVPRHIFNLFLVWALTGLWHGAAWQFLIWGMYYFLFLVLEKFFLLKWMDKWPGFLRHIYALVVILFGWVIFACPDLASAGAIYKAMLGIGVAFADRTTLFLLGGYGLLLVILAVGSTRLPARLAAAAGNRLGVKASTWICYGLCALVLAASLALLVADSYNPFLYFRF